MTQFSEGLDFGNRIAFSSPEHAELVIDCIVAERGLGLEDDIRKLYCFLISIESLAMEYLSLQYYAVAGVKTNHAHHYRDSAQFFSGLAFADGVV